MKKLGVFDIGSNTLLMTLGQTVDPKKIEILLDKGEVVRLAEGLVDGGELQAGGKERTLEALLRYQETAKHLGVTDLLAAGTAAFRRAADGPSFAREIEAKTGIRVRILSGDEEAAYSFASARHDFGSEGTPLGMIDIGGGSTELVFGDKGPNYSLPIGTVRLTEKWVRAHPIEDSDWKKIQGLIQQILQEEIPELPKIPARWVAVAATPASLAAVYLQIPVYDPKKIHGFQFPQDSLEKLVETLRLKSIPERNQMPGMDPKRSELLPVGGLILLTSMRFLGINHIVVSDHGLRYGILFEELLKE